MIDVVTEILVGECLVKIPKQPKVKTNEYLTAGAYPVIDQGAKRIAGYVDDEAKLYTGPLPVIVFGDHNQTLKFVKSRFAVGADGTQLLRPDERFDITYFFYALCALPLKHYGYERHFKYLKEERVRVPDLVTQRRIASILSAYDDLIENNTRRIAILEEMARRIYEEWFVHYRFPGHESVRMVETELGLVPEGWHLYPASQLIEINPRTKVPKEGLKPFLAMNCLADGSMLISEPAMREGNAGSKFKNGDTLFARITPCLENGKTGFVQFLPDEDATAFGSTEFIIMRSRTLTPEYVYLLARSESFRENAIKSMSGASGRQRVREACFDTYLVPQPPPDLLSHFEEAVRPMFKLIHTLASKNTNLRTTRDLLLPRLISGELDVSDLPLPEEAAAP